MNYKVEGAIKRNRKNFIIFAILWIFIAIVFVSPIAYSYHMSIANGTFDLQIFIEMLIKSITNPFATFGSIFTEGAVGNYFSTLLIVTIFYSLFFFYRICKISS